MMRVAERNYEKMKKEKILEKISEWINKNVKEEDELDVDITLRRKNLRENMDLECKVD